MQDQVQSSVDVVTHILEANSDITHIILATYPQKAAPPLIDDLDGLGGMLLRHKENDEFAPFEKGKLRREEILRMCVEVAPKKCLAIRSRVTTSANEQRYIPMLDFACEKSTASCSFLASLLHRINRQKEVGIEGGFLLETTNSYHYYGRTILPFDRWTKFIGFSLLLHPPTHYLNFAMGRNVSSVIDTRFLGHSLLAQQGSLRISADPNGHLPKVVAVI